MDIHILSPELQTYLHSIESETSRIVIINTATSAELNSMKAGFIDDPNDPDHIHILICNCLQFPDDKDVIEQSIAHEATHGLYRYKYKYIPPFKELINISDIEKFNLEIMISMISDIVVNLYIFKNNFPPYSSLFIDGIKDEMNYFINNDGPAILENEIISNKAISKIVQVWAYLTYFSIDNGQKVIDSKDKAIFTYYLTLCSYKLSWEFSIATRVIHFLQQYNVFSLDGYKYIIHKCSLLWNYDSFVVFDIQ